jgi:metallo-beta-lactamase family protein
MSSPHSKFKLLHLGAENCVTGSCHLLQANGLNIMVDCGIVQGNDPETRIEDWPLSPAKID